MGVEELATISHSKGMGLCLGLGKVEYNIVLLFNNSFNLHMRNSLIHTCWNK